MSFRTRALALALSAALVGQALPYGVRAEEGGRGIQIRYTPTARTQIAIWVEAADGTFMGTVRLTEAVAYRGIGNRPGALQMNSGFRWPYGRREGVLPIWAHRRAGALGAAQFRRVIFQNRQEGRASQTAPDQSQDNYFCLSFTREAAENLDAVSCASTFNSDKGRFITSTNVQNGYAEPWEATAGIGGSRALSFDSLYPPRRDVLMRTGNDHVDVTAFRDEALRVMPDIDAVTMATAPAQQAQLVQFDIPPQWPNGDYVLYVEANTEKDHNATYSTTAFPTPQSDDYDYWAKTYGFPYRGQPSVVYTIPFSVSTTGGTYSVSVPAGYSDNQGIDGMLRPMDATITDDPNGTPGSGADRLRSQSGVPRVMLNVLETAVCAGPNPPEACGISCMDDSACPANFLCGSGGKCVGQCETTAAPPAPANFAVTQYPNEKHTHEWARLSFMAPDARREVLRYDVRVSPNPITTDAEFIAAVNAKAAMLEIQAVSVCATTGMEITCPAPNTQVTVDIGWLERLSHYHIAVRAYDACGTGGAITTATIDTTDINFTTVSPCFVATAAYGSPMAEDVQTLRAFRDDYLMTNTPGRAFVSAYYAAGPYLAAFIRGHEGRREIARTLLSPLVSLARALDERDRSE